MLTGELTKLYYSIGEVAELFDVSTSLIRYWESEFTSLRPAKNSRGERKFTTKDIEHIDLIYNLVKERGFTLEGAKKEISSMRKQVKADPKSNAVEKLAGELIRIKAGLESIREKLNDYELR